MDNIFYAIIAFIVSGAITWLFCEVIELKRVVQRLEDKVRSGGL